MILELPSITPGVKWAHHQHDNGAQSWKGDLSEVRFNLRLREGWWTASFRLPYGGGVGSRTVSLSSEEYHIIHHNECGRRFTYIPDAPGKGLELVQTLYGAFMEHREAYIESVTKGMGLVHQEVPRVNP